MHLPEYTKVQRQRPWAILINSYSPEMNSNEWPLKQMNFFLRVILEDRWSAIKETTGCNTGSLRSAEVAVYRGNRVCMPELAASATG